MEGGDRLTRENSQTGGRAKKAEGQTAVMTSVHGPGQVSQDPPSEPDTDDLHTSRRDTEIEIR